MIPSSIPIPVIAFLIPTLLALSYPALVMLCVPKEAPPKRYIQNNFSITIFLFSSFPLAVAVFSSSITHEALAPWFAPGLWTYVSYALLGVTTVIVTGIVFQDFMCRPMAPYVLKRVEARRACKLEAELRRVYGHASHDAHTKEKKKEYQRLTRLATPSDLIARGGPIAYIHIGLTWMGVMFAAIYFWYLMAATDYTLRSKLQLDQASKNRLVIVLILLATFIPLRLHTEWYQSYFHEKNWLRKYPAFFIGVVFAIAMLLILTLLLKPHFAVGFFSVFYGLMMGALGLIAKLKPEWLRTFADLLKDLPFLQFLALYIIFLVVISIVTTAALVV